MVTTRPRITLRQRPDDQELVVGRTNSEAVEMLPHAFDLGLLGFRVFPVRAPIDGRCSCRRPACNAGKHPYITSYLARASTDPKQIESWWQQWPGANIGAACGQGLVVIDVDGPEGEEWVSTKELPETLSVKSGRGRHLYYAGASPSGIAVGPQVDVIGDGRYVVVPPSLHATGARYEWNDDVLTTRLAEAPRWINAAVAQQRGRPARRTRARATRATTVSPYIEGQRNESLFRDACAMRCRVGMELDEIEPALVAMNVARCKPPLGSAEVSSIAKSAATNPMRFGDYQLLEGLQLPPPQLAVLVALLADLNVMGECTMSYEVLAERASVSVSTAQRAVRRLKKRGVIRTTYRPFKSLRYVLDFSSVLPGSGEARRPTKQSTRRAHEPE
jgi:Bifunctional DNA primase/polymerase, N-terminal/Primase C terminal 1 (PriCT-1)/Winged helix-turn-helix DNA-binding